MAIKTGTNGPITQFYDYIIRLGAMWPMCAAHRTSGMMTGGHILTSVNT